MAVTQMWIMIAGPYKAGAKSADDARDNLIRLNRAAYEVFLKGHVPIIGVNLALPIIEAAGEHTYKKIMMPVSLAAADRCDAILRVGGLCVGADHEVERVLAHGGQVFKEVSDIPSVEE